jgi:hypothetical protein
LAAALDSSHPNALANTDRSATNAYSVTDSHRYSNGVANSDSSPDSHTYRYANRYSHDFTHADSDPNLNPDPSGAGR